MARYNIVFICTQLEPTEVSHIMAWHGFHILNGQREDRGILRCCAKTQNVPLIHRGYSAV